MNTKTIRIPKSIIVGYSISPSFEISGNVIRIDIRDLDGNFSKRLLGCSSYFGKPERRILKKYLNKTPARSII